MTGYPPDPARETNADATAASGNPDHGSGRRSVSRDSTVLLMKSLERVGFNFRGRGGPPQLTAEVRKPSRRSRELLSFSTSPSRTPAAERLARSPSSTSAAVAPCFFATPRAHSARFRSNIGHVLLFSPPNCSCRRRLCRHAQGRNPTPTGTLWPSLPQMPTPGRASFVAHLRDAGQHLGAVADQRRALHRVVTLPSSIM